jgi:hypothetical protein
VVVVEIKTQVADKVVVQAVVEHTLLDRVLVLVHQVKEITVVLEQTLEAIALAVAVAAVKAQEDKRRKVQH